jgi:L-ascorbate metabolism protein UlaG (beta-lactamase superfamily)
MIRPLQQDDSFLADVARSRGAKKGFRLWWVGQSGFLVQYEGRHLLLDPYLSDSLTKKYATTDKPHVRMTERVVVPERLDFIDVATSSHNHTDHLDAETLGPLRAANPDLRLIIPEANRSFVADRLQCDPAWPLGLTAGASVSASGFTFHGVPAAHNELETDAEGHHRFMGYVVQFGPYTIYHSGDTLLFDGMPEWFDGFDIDVAILPINGNKPERRVAGNLDGAEAARLANRIRAKVVIPCHYEMFEFNTASPDLFQRECERLGQKYTVLRAGEKIQVID